MRPVFSSLRAKQKATIRIFHHKSVSDPFIRINHKEELIFAQCHRIAHRTSKTCHLKLNFWFTCRRITRRTLRFTGGRCFTTLPKIRILFDLQRCSSGDYCYYHTLIGATIISVINSGLSCANGIPHDCIPDPAILSHR